LDSTPRQIYLQQVLGFPQPGYLHLPLVLGSDGAKLSKQNLAPALTLHNAPQELERALEFLGQSTSGGHDAKQLRSYPPARIASLNEECRIYEANNIADWLAQAVAQWRVAALTQSRR
jgi:glutamyl/glutaminyl-tRNA synthetase